MLDIKQLLIFIYHENDYFNKNNNTCNGWPFTLYSHGHEETVASKLLVIFQITKKKQKKLKHEKGYNKMFDHMVNACGIDHR